jgi:hypothetical protein
VVTGAAGALDATASVDDLRALAEVLPDEWLAPAARGTAEQCAATVVGQFDLGADSVILHGATPAELAPVVAAYRQMRPVGVGRRCGVNPGRFAG